jgi:kinesin family protein C1
VLPVGSAGEALGLVQRALAARSVAKTNANDRSSRSHTVLSLYVEGAASSVSSVIHLVDLAGSERLAHSGSDKNAKLLKETCAINSSLTALKNALRAIASKSQYVPYRDSKLTYLLQHAWQSESCKTLMIVTASQAPEFVGESINSLRFADNVRDPTC